MSQGENDSEKARLTDLTLTIGNNISEGAKKADSFFSSACIYRVPEELRKRKESAYTPRLIAIGPFHRKDKHLQTPMQHVKMSYTNYLLCRLTEGMDAESAAHRKFMVLQDCLVEMKTSLDNAVKCYAEEVALDEEMMLVDGCFILEVLYRFYEMNIPKEEEKKPSSTGGDNGNSKIQAAKPTRREKESDEGEIPPQTLLPRGEDRMKGSGRQKPKDPIFGSILTANTVQLDLLLLENQIPFIVLERLFRLTVDQIQIGTNCPRKFSLADYVSFYFQNLMTPEGNSTNRTFGPPCDWVLWVSGNQMVNSKQEVRGHANYLHILHKIHEDYRPRDQAEKKVRNELMPPASELDYAGIKFVPGTGDDLFEFKFTEPEGPFWWCRRARFEIPTLGIYDPTESFLRNLIAFEQCLPGVSQHFTSYAYLMDMLVNSDKDVQVLEKAGVVHNYLGANEEAANLFNKLCTEAALGEFLFADPCNKAAKYSKRCWPKNMADVRRTYFANPWTFIAFCLAFIAFGITITEFVFLFIYK